VCGGVGDLPGREAGRQDFPRRPGGDTTQPSAQPRPYTKRNQSPLAGFSGTLFGAQALRGCSASRDLKNLALGTSLSSNL